MLLKKDSCIANKSFIRQVFWDQAWFQGQSTITTHPEHFNSILQYHQTLFSVTFWEYQIKMQGLHIVLYHKDFQLWNRNSTM